MNTEKQTESTSSGFTWLPYALLIFPFLGAIRTISLPEFWLHIAQGREGIIRQETFSWAFSGSKYINVHALYDILLAGLNGMGVSAVILAHALAVVTGFVLLIGASKKYGSGLSAAWAVLLATWLLLPKMEVSPILFAIPFIALMIFALERINKSAVLWAVVGISQLLWTQIHPSFILGPVLCCLYGYQASKSDQEDSLSPKTYWIAAGIALGVSMLNPYGPGLHLWIFSNLYDPFLQISVSGISVISDQVGADWVKRILYICMLFAGLGLLTFKEKLPFAATASLVLVGLLTVLSIGRLSYHLLAIIGFPFLVLSFASIGNFLNTQAEDKKSILALGGVGGIAVFTLFSVFTLWTGGFYQSIGSASRLGLGIEKSSTSIEMADWMSQQDLPDTLVHLPIDGGALRYAIPERKIFIDQRLKAYPREAFLEVNQALLSGNLEKWREFDDAHRPELVLLNLTVRGSQNTARLLLSEPNWKLLRFDGTSALLIRTSSPKAAPLLANRENQMEGLKRLEAGRESLTKSLASSGAPETPLQAMGGAHLYSVLNRWQEANALYELSAAALPNYREVWMQLGVSRFQIGEFDRSVQALQKASDIMPDDALNWAWLARAYQADQRPAEAQNAFGRAKELNPELADQLKTAWKLNG